MDRQTALGDCSSQGPGRGPKVLPACGVQAQCVGGTHRLRTRLQEWGRLRDPEQGSMCFLGECGPLAGCRAGGVGTWTLAWAGNGWADSLLRPLWVFTVFGFFIPPFFVCLFCFVFYFIFSGQIPSMSLFLSFIIFLDSSETEA